MFSVDAMLMLGATVVEPSSDDNKLYVHKVKYWYILSFKSDNV